MSNSALHKPQLEKVSLISIQGSSLAQNVNSGFSFIGIERYSQFSKLSESSEKLPSERVSSPLCISLVRLTGAACLRCSLLESSHC